MREKQEVLSGEPENREELGVEAERLRDVLAEEDEALRLHRAGGGRRAARARRALAEQEQGGDRDPRSEGHALPSAALALEPIQPGGEGIRNGERHRDLPRPRDLAREVPRPP